MKLKDTLYILAYLSICCVLGYYAGKCLRIEMGWMATEMTKGH